MFTETIQLYEGREDVTLTTYVLDDSLELLNGKKRPAVLICPGGAYMGCSDREGEPVALRFASMGYHAFVLRYSTYGNGKPLPAVLPSDVVEPNPNSIHPAPVRDIGRAFLEIHAHADQWLVDTDQIAICGFSAGGHNCAMYSVCWNDPIITEHFGEAPEKFRPAAAILAYAVLDYRLMIGGLPDPISQQISDAATMAFFGTKTPDPEILDAVSPVIHVGQHTPPTFLWTTFEDELVPVENTTRMANALAQAGVPFEAHIFEKGGHGLSLANQATAGSKQDMQVDVEQWIVLADAWLQKHFTLPIPEKPAWMVAMEAKKD